MGSKGSLPATALRQDLVEYRNKRPRGGLAELSRLSGVSQQTIGRVADGQETVTVENWLKLHQAAPSEISAPSLDGVTMGDLVSTLSGSAVARVAVSASGELRALPGVPSDLAIIPAYRLTGKGAPTFQEGLPMGGHPRHVPTKRTKVAPNTFGVVMLDSAMEPTVREGDMVVVTPGEPISDGDMCLAVWRDRPHNVLVRRYFQYGDTVVLRADKPGLPEIRLTTPELSGLNIHRVIRAIHETEF